MKIPQLVQATQKKLLGVHREVANNSAYKVIIFPPSLAVFLGVGWFNMLGGSSIPVLPKEKNGSLLQI